MRAYLIILSNTGLPVSKWTIWTLCRRATVPKNGQFSRIGQGKDVQQFSMVVNLVNLVKLDIIKTCNITELISSKCLHCLLLNLSWDVKSPSHRIHLLPSALLQPSLHAFLCDYFCISNICTALLSKYNNKHPIIPCQVSRRG